MEHRYNEAIHGFGTGFNMASSFATMSEDDTLATNEAVVPTNSRKQRNLTRQCLLVGRRVFFHCFWDKDVKMQLTNLRNTFNQAVTSLHRKYKRIWKNIIYTPEYPFICIDIEGIDTLLKNKTTSISAMKWSFLYLLVWFPNRVRWSASQVFWLTTQKCKMGPSCSLGISLLWKETFSSLAILYWPIARSLP